MKINDMESLIQITREIETHGYTLHSVESEEKYSGRPTLEITLKISRKRDAPEYDGTGYINPKPN
jgi:hypothetical protein